MQLATPTHLSITLVFHLSLATWPLFLHHQMSAATTTFFPPPPPPPPVPIPTYITSLGLGYSIAIALGFLVLISTIILSSSVAAPPPPLLYLSRKLRLFFR
ncbi:hypothetical protein Bca52824_078124 [Brassica carinata]|uniref:Transmembrane protein n=1 Tax=Brassica carinata TaxID=52824 RepID=A0A8X7PW87_BRACI|nr:hypothetical protein Bca52824_078124 [Brassica carinata]